jgi:hypothetical protein
MDRTSETRRDFFKKAAYVAPAILTLQAAPSYAKSGSEKPDKGPKDGKGHGKSAMDNTSSITGAPLSSQLPRA